jgi:hypothetical protein
MESDTRYELTTSFEYSYQGDQLSSSFLTLREPNATQLGDVGKIRKWVNLALRQNREELDEEGQAVVAEAEQSVETTTETDEDTEVPETIDGGTIIALMSKGDVPLDQFYLTVQRILQGPGISVVDGVTKMTPPLWKKMSAHDMELMLGHYVGVFFLR